MAGITDSAFRSFMREMGCGPVISELVSSHGIEHQSKNTMKIMSLREDQRPVAIQLFGEEPDIVARAARYVQDVKKADFVDLNFGCPVPKVVKKGAGSAILKDLDALQKMVSTVKKAIDIPLTIKIRTGWDDSMRNAVEVANIAHNEGVEWVAIHGRTRAQGYSGSADWEYIAEVKSRAKLPIIGNGDIQSAAQAVDRLKKYGLDGVMIGRGCLKNPWIFQEARNLMDPFAASAVTDKSFADVFAKLRTYLETECEPRIVEIQLKKFAAWFSAGYPGASNFRRNLFASASFEELLTVIETYFEAIRLVRQSDTSSEAFLMGGHG